MLNLFSLPCLTRSHILWQSNTIGCCNETSLRTWFVRSSRELSNSAASSSFSSVSSLSSKLFLVARRLKKLLICWLVRNSSLLNKRSPSFPLACIISFATTTGSALCPVVSPILNFVGRYSFCFTLKRVLRFWDDLHAMPIGRVDCSGTCFGTSWTFRTQGTPTVWTSSLSAYPKTAWSRSGSRSRARVCFPESRCCWRFE